MCPPRLPRYVRLLRLWAQWLAPPFMVLSNHYHKCTRKHNALVRTMPLCLLSSPQTMTHTHVHRLPPTTPKRTGNSSLLNPSSSPSSFAAALSQSKKRNKMVCFPIACPLCVIFFFGILGSCLLFFPPPLPPVFTPLAGVRLVL